MNSSEGSDNTQLVMQPNGLASAGKTSAPDHTIQAENTLQGQLAGHHGTESVH